MSPDQAAQKEAARRRSVIVDTHIGWGSPDRQDTKEAHGEALGVEEVRLTKIAYGWPPDAQFLVPDEVKKYMRKAVERGAKWEQEWNAKYQRVGESISRARQTVAADVERRAAARLGQRHSHLPRRCEGTRDRESNCKVLNAVAKNVPWLLGGAADLISLDQDAD